MSLESTNPSKRTEQKIRGAFGRLFHRRRRLQTNFEHGQWWITDQQTGAQWSVVDATGPGSDNGFSFEQVSPEDEN